MAERDNIEVIVSGVRQPVPEGKPAPGTATRIASNNILQRERPPDLQEFSAEGELRLGEFATKQSLSVSEAAYLVEAIMAQRKAKHGRNPPSTETLYKMQNYMDTFARFKDRPQLDELESLLRPFDELVNFERSQLISLCPGDPEEAKTLIPSMASKISDEDLLQLLQDIASVKRR